MKEIERKFLAPRFKAEGRKGQKCVQGYFDGDTCVRVRIMGSNAWLTVKGPTVGATRDEFEYPIPIEDARRMLELCATTVEKVRYKVKHGNHTWDVDKFLGANRGLILAEVELSNEKEVFEKPDWASTEVTGWERYYNSQLAKPRKRAKTVPSCWG